MNVKYYPVIATILFASVGPIEPITRTFANIAVPPYRYRTPITIAFTYQTDVRENTMIEVYFTNSRYNHELLLARALENITSFQGSLSLPADLLSESHADLNFVASGSNFSLMQPLTIYQRQYVPINVSNETGHTYVTTANYATIDSSGAVNYLEESIAFSNFFPIIERDVYLIFDLGAINFMINPIDALNISVSKAQLIISDPYLNFPLLRRSDDGFGALFNYDIITMDDLYQLVLTERLFVDERTLLVSSFPIEGFIETRQIYLPKDRFSALKTMPLTLTFSLSLQNDYAIIYQPLVHYDRALIGSCQTAKYCLTTSWGTIDGGYWKDISTSHD